VRKRIAVVYNEPQPSRYDNAGEAKAVLGVLNAVTAVHSSLLELGHDVSLVPLAAPPGEASRVFGQLSRSPDRDESAGYSHIPAGKLASLDVDLVFNLFEGFCGEPETEALVPEVLSELGIPCTGCPGTALRLALDKAKVKVLLKAAGIPTPDFQLLNHQTLHMFQLGYPCLVKPRGEDASHGITEGSVVSNFTDLARQVHYVSNAYGSGALVEEFIDGREFNATVLGDSPGTVLPVSEINYSLPSGMPRILTFAAKWEPDSPYFQGTKVVCPAELGACEREQIVQTALSAFRLIGSRGYARVDMRMDREGRLNVIEVNPNPDISPDAGAARQAAAAGMTYTRFIEKIVQMALEEEYHDHQDASHVKKRQASRDGDTAEYAGVQAV
jgi:D-alanine-D-alanine ligase